MSVYLKAAKELVKAARNNYDYRFACNAIERVGGDSMDIKRMERYFKPDGSFIVWYSNHEDGTKDLEFDYYTDLGNLGRSLMLLFMHEICGKGSRREIFI